MELESVQNYERNQYNMNEKKTVTIGEENGVSYLEVKGQDKNGVHFRRRTNEQSKIMDYLLKEGTQFIDAKKVEKDLLIYTSKNIVFVVKNHEQLHSDSIFQEFLTRVNKAPIVGKNLDRGKRSNIPQLLGLKMLYINRAKLAAIALSGALLVTTVPGWMAHMNQSNEVELNMTTDVMLEPNSTLTDSIVNPEIIEEQEAELIEPKQTPQVDIKKLVLNSLEQEKSFDYRLEQTMQLQADYGQYDNSKIMVGARVNASKMKELFSSSRGKIIIDTATKYGIDPYLLAAKGLTESGLKHEDCIPGGIYYNGYGVGAFQLEVPHNSVVEAWNYETSSEDSLEVSMESAIDFEKNTQAAAMYFQRRMEIYNGNVYLALQSYNYGTGMMKLVLHDYAEKMGITEEEVKNNPNDLGWLEIVEDIHLNPNDYYYRVLAGVNETDPNVLAEAKSKYVWNGKTYGNSHYIADVLSYYVGLSCQNRNIDGTITVTNFEHNATIQVSKSELNMNELSNNKIL